MTSTGTQSAGPPAEPILRIETGMHTAMINRVGVDAAGRFLVTGSDDKTVRVWDLASGRLLRTLRPPIGTDREGQIYAVSLSPDGETVAAGGWTGYEWDGRHSIYFFDRASGRLVRRIGGLPSVVKHLTFSPDGNRLAAALGGSYGIRLVRAADGAELEHDADYGGASYWADFDKAGRLVTSSEDGFVRLYGPDLTRLAEVKAPGSIEPFGVRFSPDGREVAVGYYDSTRVDVLSGNDLRPVRQPDTAGVTNGNLGRVAWSADGRALYAAGRYYSEAQRPIRRWAEADSGAPTDLTGGVLTTVMDLQSLPGGRLAFAAGDPAWGVLGADGQREAFTGPTIGDFRGAGAGFRLDPTGSVARFGFELWGKTPATFDARDRTLAVEPGDDSRLQPPRTEAPGLSVTSWEDSKAPALNGTPIELDRFETSRSLAVAADGQSFLLGADWTLRSFDRTGKERWQAPVPGTAWAVNLSGDGRLAVAALGDGTIRWYRAADGVELLAFFPHADRKRWVAWTPTGYYDASVGGEELIGWHVNRGPDEAADWFPASRFRDRFYRPGIVSRVLDTLDEAEALTQADAVAHRTTQDTVLTRLLPPVVSLLAPADGAEVSAAAVTFRVAIRSPSGERVTAVRAFVDGRPATAARGVVHEPDPAQPAAAPEAERTYTFAVPVPARDCTVAILAETRFATGEPVPLKLCWAAPPPAVEKPVLYLLAVGVSAYADPSYRLDWAAKDALDVVTTWRGQTGKLYQKVEVCLLTDEEATRDAIADGLEWLERQSTERDLAVLFFAGHGVNDPRRGYHFLPHDGDLDKLRSTLISGREVRDVLNTLTGKVLVFLDTCRSGSLFGDTKTRDLGDVTGFVNELAAAENGVVVFSASTGRQLSQESSTWKNGAFTKALVEALAGKADRDQDGSIRITDVQGYVYDRVKTLTKGLQTPAIAIPESLPDFPVALVK